MNFLEQICERAKADKKTIVLPEGNDIRTLQAASMVAKQGIANVIVIGNKIEVEKLGVGIDLSKVAIVDHLQYKGTEDFANTFYEMRKAKGITLEQAIETMKNPLYFGVMMVKKGIADGMVAGAINATSNTVRPALQILRTAPGT